MFTVTTEAQFSVLQAIISVALSDLVKAATTPETAYEMLTKYLSLRDDDNGNYALQLSLGDNGHELWFIGNEKGMDMVYFTSGQDSNAMASTPKNLGHVLVALSPFLGANSVLRSVVMTLAMQVPLTAVTLADDEASKVLTDDVAGRYAHLMTIVSSGKEGADSVEGKELFISLKDGLTEAVGESVALSLLVLCSMADKDDTVESNLARIATITNAMPASTVH